MLVNPRKRKRKKSTTKRRKRRTYAKRRRNPIAANPRRRKTYRKRRRNPAKMNIGNVLQNTVLPAATAAGGAIGIDVLMGMLPIPENLKSGPMRHLVKGGAAIAAGMLAANFVKPKTAELFVNGAMTVVMYDAGREMIARFMPDMAARMGLSGMGLYYDDNEMMGLGYTGAGYIPEEENMGLYYDTDEMSGLSDYEDDYSELTL